MSIDCYILNSVLMFYALLALLLNILVVKSSYMSLLSSSTLFAFDINIIFKVLFLK